VRGWGGADHQREQGPVERGARGGGFHWCLGAVIGIHRLCDEALAVAPP
jgi:hypothetical protein